MDWINGDRESMRNGVSTARVGYPRLQNAHSESIEPILYP